MPGSARALTNAFMITCLHLTVLMNDAELAPRRPNASNDVVELLRGSVRRSSGCECALFHGAPPERRRPRHRRPAACTRSASFTASGASPSMTGMMGCSPGNQIEAQPPASARGSSARWRAAACAVRRTLQQVEHLQRGRRDRRRDAVGEQIGPRALAQPADDFPARGDIAAAGAAQGLAEGAGEDVDPADDAAQFMRAAAARADEAGGVRVVDHDQRAVAVGEVADLLRAWRSSRPWKTRRRWRSGAPGRSGSPSSAFSSSFMSLLA